MKADLRLPSPCLHWQALALMLDRRQDFRDDVTMVIEPDWIRFVDSGNREIRKLPHANWLEGEYPSLDDTVSLLDWIEEEFPEQVAS